MVRNEPGCPSEKAGNLFLFPCAASLLLWLCLAFGAAPAATAQSLDESLLRSVYFDSPPVLEGAFDAAHHTAYPAFGLVPVSALVVGWVRQDRQMLRFGLEAGAAVGGAVVSAVVLKNLVQRPRPYTELDDITSRTGGVDAMVIGDRRSMPSGHASLSFALATSAALNYPRWEVVSAGYAWAVLVAGSRLWLGLHYPSDVLAGAALGTSSAVLVHLASDALDLETRIGWGGGGSGLQLIRISVPL